MNRKTLLAAAALLALATGPALAERNNSAGEGGGDGTHGAGVHSAPFGGGGGVQYSIPAGQREPSRQPTGSVAGKTGVGVCGCH